MNSPVRRAAGPAPGGAQAAFRRVTSALGGVVVVVMMLYIVANALSRTLFDHPLPASLEIVQYLLMPGLVTVGFVAATLAGRHVSADLLFSRFPPSGRRAAVVGAHLVSAGTLAVVVWFSWEHALTAQKRHFKAGYTDVPSWPLYFFVPVALGLSVLIMLGKAWTSARRPLENYTAPSAGHDHEEIEQRLGREIG